MAATGEHNYADWTVDIEPTYDSTGWEYSSCTVCGNSTGRDIPVLVYVNPFKDVKESHWFYDAVEFCVKYGIVAGMTEDTFAPNNNLTRAQFLMLLAKADGADIEAYTGAESGFEDVKPSHWYNEVVCWAVENEYTSGLSATKFGPNNNITRAQLARFFYVYVEKNGLDVSESADLSVFPDADKVQSWAEVPVKWAVARGFIAGMNGKLEPNGNSTRAQAARIMMLVDEAEFVSADPVERILSTYPQKLMYLGNFESVNDISAYTAFDWALGHTEKISFTGDDENTIYTYTYSGAEINDFLSEHLGITNDYPALVGKHQGDMVEIRYDADTDTVTVIYYGAFGGFGGPDPVYDGYEQTDDTHFVISYHEVDSDWKGQLDVELKDGNYIVTAKRSFK
ncbi:MAG: S-layer homology domain-containing protein [Clostridia bacterium]|nr:S-layer homology domain-containing protein [Clostridia bacterium]